MSGIYQHFRAEEKEFIDQVIDWRQNVEDFYSPKLTDFLDPRQQLIVSSIIGENNDVCYSFFGGSEQSERKRALIYPDYFQPTENDFQVGLYEVDYPKKFIRLDHRMVLGSMMSLGLTRDKFGDIIIGGDRIQLLLAEEIEDFILTQFNQIGRANVTIQKSTESPIESDEVWHESEKTASSMRLDTVLATAHNLSRQRAQSLIQQGLVRVNWEKVEQTSFECMAGDILSARGFGRCKIIGIHGKTRKDKWRLTLGVLK